MKRLYFLLCALIAIPAVFASDIVVVDAEDANPVVAASVFSKSGVIFGMTDSDGRLTGLSENDYPIVVRCLGYSDAECNAQTDTVRLCTSAIELAGLVVTPADRPVTRVLCYIREYSGVANAKDTVQIFSEHMADYYIATQKVKKFKSHKTPRVLGSLQYARRKSSDGRDSIYRPDYRGDDVSWLDLLTLPDNRVEESEAVRMGARTDTVNGKYCVKKIVRKTDNMYVESIDYLADTKDHKLSPMMFKLLGFTMDFNDLYTSWAYMPNDGGKYSITDLIYGTMSTRVLGRGKWIKRAFNSDTPVEINGLFEVYPVEIEHLTVEEAREQLDNPPAVQMRRSPNALPLPAATQRLVEAFNAQSASK